jgi:metal-responsive CopG/Arc/MetJ family transcriptional regulator
MTGHTPVMKIAISLPDDLSQQIDACAKRLRIPRSRLLADGARLILAKYGMTDATEAWNAAIEAAGQPGDDPAAVASRKRSRQSIRKSTGGW